MTYSDETLMAYVDGELDAPTRAAIDGDLRVDADLLQRVQEQRALREQISDAFDPVLDEPVPERLLAAARKRRAASNVIDLASARGPRRAWRWPEWGAMAACLMVGVFVGQSALGPAMPIAADAGRLVAAGQLDAALTTRIASDAAGDAGARVGLSFVSKGGEYCRTFALAAEGAAGLACRRGGRWQVEVLAHAAGAAAAPERYRQAGSALPDAVLRAVDERISGEALDAQQEREAAARGWR